MVKRSIQVDNRLKWRLFWDPDLNEGKTHITVSQVGEYHMRRGIVEHPWHLIA